METLFVLKKKFCSRRVVRTIYEYLDERAYWLKQYRYAIHHGHTTIPNSRISFGPQGVLSAFLLSTPLHPATVGYTYYRFSNMRNHLKGRLFVLLNNMEKIDIPYVTPVMMNRYDGRYCFIFSTEMLRRNCVENNLPVNTYSRTEFIRNLMTI